MASLQETLMVALKGFFEKAELPKKFHGNPKRIQYHFLEEILNVRMPGGISEEIVGIIY